ncbi:sensor domain-containing diguanylate cyclase [Aureimonas ureilytica]|uniref:sensor domain-containing diguanylate cyclase n=1 Tax=Aureimonas ureilytica TaxID=401562 RepID=UPI000381A72C|nr:sensor domain-containing diguanylate cyclase [Aureimonas ureilytica]
MTSVDIDLIGVPVFVVDVEPDGVFRLVAINAADARVVGVDALAVAGRRIEDCVPPDLAAPIIARFSTCVASADLMEYDEQVGSDVSPKWLRTTLTPVVEPTSRRVVRIVGVCVEITERKAIETELARAVVLDPLTGVMNRRGLEREVEAAIDHGREADEAFGLALIDIDQFKSINDTYGHRVGDAVLCHVANTLQAALSDGEVVARIGGDEFVALLRLSSPNDLHERRASLQRLMDRDALLVGRAVHVRASLGCAIWHDPWTLDDLLSAADADMYRNKIGRREAA